MGCSCTDSEYSGLGQISPSMVGELTSAIVNAKQMWDNLQAALGIGAGRREADVITPIQNRLVSSVIAPLTDYLTNLKNGAIQPDCNQLNQDIGIVTQAEKSWLDYLHNTKWTDGRAAQQAEATLAPYFTGLKTGLPAAIQQYCGSATTTVGTIPVIGPLLTTATGDINWPVVAVGGGLIFMLMRRK